MSSTSICSTSSSSRALPRWSIIMQIEVAALLVAAVLEALGKLGERCCEAIAGSMVAGEYVVSAS